MALQNLEINFQEQCGNFRFIGVQKKNRKVRELERAFLVQGLSYLG